jgi:TolB protein
MTMRRFTALILALALWPAAAGAVLTIEITEGVSGARPVAVVPFAHPDDVRPNTDIAEVVATDLARSGRFSPMAREELPARPRRGGEMDMDQWRQAGQDHVLVGAVDQGPDGLVVRTQLMDPYREEQVFGYRFQAPQSGLRRLGHRLADRIYEAVLDRRGAFSTSMAYVRTEQETGDKPRYILAVADADGRNEQVILDSGQPLMSPAWSPDGRRLAYVSFEGGRPGLWIQTVTSGSRERIGPASESRSAPAFSPDGRYLAWTRQDGDNTDIYITDLERGGEPVRVTRHWSIDTEPAWLPSGEGLIFTSDRAGSPQLYEVELDGRARPVSDPERITFEGNYNASADVAPDGRHVALVHRNNNGFRIAVLDRERGGLEVVAETTMGESPSFAPNGDMILYAAERAGRGVLESVSSDGRARQRLGMDIGNVREPAWSPFDALTSN